MTRTRVLMVQVECGSGHKVPALAIKEAMERLYPDRFEVEVIDFAKTTGAHKDDFFMKWAWDVGLANPWLAKIVYVLHDRYLRWLARRWVRINFPTWIRKATDFIGAWKPDLVLSTHFYSTTVAGLARERLQATWRLFCYVSDPFDSFTWWAERRADEICVASERARDLTVNRGFPQDRVHVLRYPVLRKFLGKGPDRDQVRARLGLDPACRTMLTTLGGQGIGELTDYVEEVYKMSLPLNILAVCGRNDAARQRLERLAAAWPSRTRLVPLGYVGNMEELLTAADFCVAKAGASTTLEALARGAPVLFTSFACYNEKPNIDWCLEHEAGWYAPTRADFFQVLRQIQETDVLERYRTNIRALDLPIGADDMARFVARKMGVE